MCMCSVCVCVYVYIYVCIYIYIYTYFMCTYIQGGSDKSGIFLFYLLNGTTQLKIIRFYCSEKKIADIHIEN